MKNIEEVKKDFEKKDSVFLICCHITNSKSLNLLRNLVDRIEERGYEFILSSHTLVPPDIIGRSSGFLYDKFNDKISIDPIMIFWTQVGNYKISSPYLSYGGIADETYVLGAVKNRTNGNVLGYSLGYKKIHLVEYDAEPDFEDLKENEEILSSGFDLVVYKNDGSSMLGSIFSYSLSEKNKDFNVNFYSWMDRLERDKFFSEECFFNFANELDLKIFQKSKITQMEGSITSFINSGRVENILLKFNNSANLFLFLNNRGWDRKIIIYSNSGKKEIQIGKNCWSIIDLEISNPTYVDIYDSEGRIKKWDISSPEMYEKYVYCNKVEII